MFPTWSPDGNKIAFSEGGALSIMNADGSNLISLNVSVQNHETGGGISWSPDGSKLLYSTPGPYQIHVINVDGSGDTNLSNSNKQEKHPVWSPDGAKIAFSYNQNLIYVMNADGSEKGPLMPGSHVYGVWPDWTP